MGNSTVPGPMSYDVGLHVGAIFLVLGASALGTAAPLLTKRFRDVRNVRFLFSLGKQMGTGVLLGLSYVHLLDPATKQLSDPILGSPWVDYPFAMLFALLATLVMHLLETLMKERVPSHHYRHKKLGSSGDNAPPLNLPPTSSSKITQGAKEAIAAFILEAGLSVHSIVIGITIGVAPNSHLAGLLSALCFHQLFEGLALGSVLADLGFSSLKETSLALIYCVSAPIGIAIGIGVQSTYDEESLAAKVVQGTLDAVSAGIIFYVAFIQMLGQEFIADWKASEGWIRKAALLAVMWIGAGVMSLFGIWL